MVRFTTDIIGAQILLFQEHATLGPIKRLIFSPETGEVLGLVVYDPIQKKEAILQPASIKKLAGDIIIADGYDALSAASDLIRVEEALRVDPQIVKERVYTESGQFLGKVVGATIETISWKLNRLYVNPPLGLGLLAKELLIPAKKIVKIEKKQIIVTDDYARIKGTKAVSVPTPVLD